MDPGWRFTLGDPAGAEQPKFDDQQWRALDLPHDWSIEGTPSKDAPGGGRLGFFPMGTGWYRKSFKLPGGARGQKVWLEFDGVYMNSDVWINGVHLGHRPYGYISFAYDVTDHLVSGINVVAVRVDNSRQPSSRWYTGSGIYRHVWLSVVDPLHVGHWGTYLTTPRADSARADVLARTVVENGYRTPRKGVLRSTVVDSAGREVARAEAPFPCLRARRSNWSSTSRSALRFSGRSRHRTSTHSARPSPTAAEPPTCSPRRSESAASRTTRIEGSCSTVGRSRCEASTCTTMPAPRCGRPGTGLAPAAHDVEADGANAIRTSHNPPAPEFLDLCDRLGFLVMAEAFDEWTIGKVPEGYHNYFDEWSERDVTDFVHRDRNHPSIVLWSAGNEIGEQTTPDGVGVLRRLVEIFHREDPTRPVTTGNDNIAADGHPTTLDFLNAEDIVGYNYVDRWHERRELFAAQDRHDHPEWKMIGTESGTIFQSFDEQYSLGPDSTVVRPNYNHGMLAAERRWKWVTLNDYFAGDFMWTGIDYLGEATWPFKGFGSGVMDITGRPKDSYYLYQSLWTDRPVLHLFPHWNWPGRNGQVIPVLAYTNCNSVELFLNGRSLGEKRLEFPAQGTSGGWNTYAQPVVNATTNDLHLSWDVPYEPGVLKAVGKRRDGSPACEAEVRTAGPPAAIRLDDGPRHDHHESQVTSRS